MKQVFTDEQEALLRALVPAIKAGTVGTNWNVTRVFGGVIIFDGLGSTNSTVLPTLGWSEVTTADFATFARWGIFTIEGKDRYSLDKQALLNAEAQNFRFDEGRTHQTYNFPQAAIANVGSTLNESTQTIQNAQAAMEEQRLKRRHDDLKSYMDTLRRNLAEYEVWLSKHWGYQSPPPDSPEGLEHSRIIGEAIATCHAVGDYPDEVDESDGAIESSNLPDVSYRPGTKTHVIHRLDYIADKRLTRNQVTENTAGKEEEIKKWGHYQDRNRAALLHAVKRLAYLIEQL